MYSSIASVTVEPQAHFIFVMLNMLHLRNKWLTEQHEHKMAKPGAGWAGGV